MPRLVFSSDELPAQLDDRARFSLWRDLFAAGFGRLEFSRPSDRPFSLRFEFAHFGSVGLGQFGGTVNRVVRSPGHIAADTSPDVCLVLNRGRSAMSSVHHAREIGLAPGAATLYSDCEAAELRGSAENAISFLNVPRRRLCAFVANAEDLAGAALDPAQPAVRHLRRYLEIVLNADGLSDDPALSAHVDTTLFDLVALALGATREGAEIAQMRGLRAARLQEILAEIRVRFGASAFSPRDVARTLCLSPRYVQDLLHEAGASFTERVTELRLQKARGMLSDARHDRMKVIDIAQACGFDNVSYFNRCFRRRYGASPTQYRGGKAES